MISFIFLVWCFLEKQTVSNHIWSQTVMFSRLKHGAGKMNCTQEKGRVASSAGLKRK